MPCPYPSPKSDCSLESGQASPIHVKGSLLLKTATSPASSLFFRCAGGLQYQRSACGTVRAPHECTWNRPEVPAEFWSVVKTMSQQERRQYSRKTLNPLPYINLPSGNGGIVLDVSEQGLRFRALAPVELSGPIDFSFTAHSRLVTGTGELVWIDPAKKMGGLRFTELPYKAIEQIRNLPFNENLRPEFGEDLSMHIPPLNDSQPSGARPRGAIAARGMKFASEINRIAAEFFGSKRRGNWFPAKGIALAKLRALTANIRLPRNNRRLIPAFSAAFLGIVIIAAVYTGHRAAGELLIRMGTRLSGSSATAAPAPAVATPTPRVDEGPVVQAKAEIPPALSLPEPVIEAAAKPAKEIPPETVAETPSPKPQEAPARLPKPAAARGDLVVQVAALTQEADARELTEKLRQEKFEAFVGTLPADSYYRVMLGPYADAASAREVIGKLKKAGFNSFIRRETPGERAGSLGKAAPRQEPAT